MSVVLAKKAGQALLARGWKLAVAESCTGGLLGHLITRVPGSSAYFLGGIIAYDNAIKEKLLDVKAELLARYGAVSAPCALAMAQGARVRFGADVALSITGIAGPGGGTPDKPVGLVYIGLVTAGGARVWEHRWTGNRYANQLASAQAALIHLLEEVSHKSVAQD